MKTICLITAMLLSLATSSFCQIHLTMNLEETDFSIFVIQNEKKQSTRKIKIIKQLVTLENVKTITFQKNDSLALLLQSGLSVNTRLTEINEVSKYEYRISPVLGFFVGAIGGGIIGGYIAKSVYENSTEPHEMGDFLWVIGTTVLGAIGGGIICTVITDLVINHSNLNLFSVPEKHKKKELIRFLRH